MAREHRREQRRGVERRRLGASLRAAAAARRSRSAAAAARAGTPPRRASGRRASSSRSRRASARAARRSRKAPSGSRSARSAPALRRAEVERVRHQVERAGRRCHVDGSAAGAPSGSRPARRSSAQVRISGRPISAVGSSDSHASTQGDAERLDLGAAGAVVRRLGAQVALDLGVAQGAEADRDRDAARRHESRSPRQTTATAVWKTTVRPRIARSCAVARA